MSVIDHRYFPHIIDLVFEHATLHELFMLRQACRAWRAKAARRFTHVRGFTSEYRVYYRANAYGYSRAPLLRDMFQLGDGPRLVLPEGARGAAGALLAHCRLLDVGPFASLAGFSLPALHTVRFTARSFLDGTVLPAHTRRAVFDSVYPGDLRCWRNVAKVVIVERGHFSDARAAPRPPVADDRAPLPHSLKEVVYIHLGEGEPHYLAIDCVQTAAVDGVHITSVNMPQRVVDVPTSFLDYNDHASHRDVTFMSLEQYREHVGETEFAIETDCRASLSP